jgi:predicted metal-dependent hydrolase
MRALEHLSPSNRISGAWCNSDIVISAVLEALSFATPPLERFFIRAVSDAMKNLHESTTKSRAREFVQEESQHSSAHRRFNRALAGYLQAKPPGLRQIESVLDLAATRLSPSARLLSVELMEQGSALGSSVYLWCESRLTFDCPFARHLFAQHAREEMGHSAVIRDLRGAPRISDLFIKAAACAVIAAAGTAYLAVAVPWIILRKSRVRRLNKDVPK